ncbi:MAG: hypothetical protein ACKN9W_16240 [Methylococcus sp.]
MAVDKANLQYPSCLSFIIDGKGLLINTLIGVLSLALTSCTVNDQLLPKVPLQPPPIKKGVVEIQIKEANNPFGREPSYSSMNWSPIDITDGHIKPYINDIMLQWQSNNLIANHGYASELKTRPDYILSISGKIYRYLSSALEEVAFFRLF